MDALFVQQTQCYRCNSWRHFSDLCPNAGAAPAQTGQIMAQIGQCLTQGVDRRSIIDDNWLLLGSCSTVSCIKNIVSVHNIKTCTSESEMCVYTNGSHKDYNQIASLNLLLFTVYVNKDPIANILPKPLRIQCTLAQREQCLFMFWNTRPFISRSVVMIYITLISRIRTLFWQRKRQTECFDDYGNTV